MKQQANGLACPSARPVDPRFSSGPCKKHPNWDPANIPLSFLSRSHRAKQAKARIHEVASRSAQMLGLPDDWQLGLVPASDTGAFEMALWSMLGARPVDLYAWENFSHDWAQDIEEQLDLENVHSYKAAYGEIPDLDNNQLEHDQVFVYNGTTSGVRLPHLDWISSNHKGLVFCDATSAVFAMDIDYQKLDVVTWSWQKSLGGEGGFGMLALSPKAIARLESYQPARPLPKIFRLTKKGSFDKSIFQGSTINTPSMWAVEDIHSALDWADSIGGLPALIQRSQDNFDCLDRWVEQTPWADWLASEPTTRSTTSMCLRISDPSFGKLDLADQYKAITTICKWLEEEGVAFDIASYRSAPPGFRIWGGPTVDMQDILALLPWLEWAFQRWKSESIINDTKET